MDALMAKMDRLQNEIDAKNGWELDRQLERATDALRCPPGALCCAVLRCAALRCAHGLLHDILALPVLKAPISL